MRGDFDEDELDDEVGSYWDDDADAVICECCGEYTTEAHYTQDEVLLCPECFEEVPK